MSYPDEWGDFEEGYCRHLRGLGFVPPEFQDHQRIPARTAYVCTTTDAAMKSLLPMFAWDAIEAAATLAHRRAFESAEGWRKTGGYDRLSPERTIDIPDQRPLLQGGDNDPLN